MKDKKKRFKILVLYPSSQQQTGFCSEEFLRRIGERLPECDIVAPSKWSEEEIMGLVRDADVILGSTVPRKIIEAGKNLKLIQTAGTGVDKIDIEAAAEKGVLVCNAVGLNAIWVAEHATVLILALAKNLTKLDDETKKGIWRKRYPQKLHGKTLGIIGLGSIGTEIARRMRAFGMRILAIKRSPCERFGKKLGIDFLGGSGDLDYILVESDFLVISVVLTPETKGMIGTRELDMMKRTAFLINISRGQVIDESALIETLDKHKIAGAGLDVFDVEPISSDNPLLRMDNVILTPHIGGGSSLESSLERVEFVAKNIRRVLQGGKPLNAIDTKLKY